MENKNDNLPLFKVILCRTNKRNLELSVQWGGMNNQSPQIITKLDPAKPTEVFDTYWKFAAKRQDIFFNKFKKKYPPWTSDPILKKYKFTNAYRASDRVSQYLIKNVIYSGPQSVEDIFFRTILFKIFNKVETWEKLRNTLGEITYQDYKFKKYNAVLTRISKNGDPIYSGAYIMASGKNAFGYSRKHRNHLRLLEKMMDDDLPYRISNSESMNDAFLLLKSYPSIGDFLAYQYVTDLNYSEIIDFSEMEFVVPGPGANSGIYKCFNSLGGLKEPEIIRLVTDIQEQEFDRLGLDFKDLWGRRLQLIDCQNLFCEVDKYSRVAHPNVKGVGNRKQIKQKYEPQKDQIHYWYPPKWGLNKKVKEFVECNGF